MLLTRLAGLLPVGLRGQGAQGFTTAAELAAATGLRCIGTLPQRPRHMGTPVCEKAFSTAVQGIASRLGLLAAGTEGRVVLVTSAVPSEGRSTLCQALAEALLAAGQRVLLLDARASGSGPAGAAGAAARPCLVAVRDRPAFGALPDAERIGEFAQFLDDARLHFDTILLTGAPVMRSADSLILGGMSDRIVTVVRRATTPRRVVQAALRRLAERSLAVEGVVLNDVAPRHDAAAAQARLLRRRLRPGASA
ncbi:hypothetical protein QMO56_02110 [Roseomonas sp. E05]|uniref:hypothetical protein n=1 Tax=Roseomonas sp. E05 TaxID=3046310 RepID=UPI0024B97CF7|nr:hypothetical protein [Roseomonas sp. E05]MDJ0386895.1 hypothetical protein [Roseomonas sp. E05]